MLSFGARHSAIRSRRNMLVTILIGRRRVLIATMVRAHIILLITLSIAVTAIRIGTPIAAIAAVVAIRLARRITRASAAAVASRSHGCDQDSAHRHYQSSRVTRLHIDTSRM